MREIKFLGAFRKEGVSRSYQYSVFECDVCGKRIEKIRKDGIKAQACSHKCARTGKERGAYKERVEISEYLYLYLPKEHLQRLDHLHLIEHHKFLMRSL